MRRHKNRRKEGDRERGWQISSLHLSQDITSSVSMPCPFLRSFSLGPLLTIGSLTHHTAGNSPFIKPSPAQVFGEQHLFLANLIPFINTGLPWYVNQTSKDIATFSYGTACRCGCTCVGIGGRCQSWCLGTTLNNNSFSNFSLSWKALHSGGCETQQGTWEKVMPELNT
jgi:hypothetical protein